MSDLGDRFLQLARGVAGGDPLAILTVDAATETLAAVNGALDRYGIPPDRLRGVGHSTDSVAVPPGQDAVVRVHAVRGTPSPGVVVLVDSEGRAECVLLTSSAGEVWTVMGLPDDLPPE